MTKYITYISTYKTSLNQYVKLWNSRKNDWGQRDIINRFKILTKGGSDDIHDIITKKCQKISL